MQWFPEFLSHLMAKIGWKGLESAYSCHVTCGCVYRQVQLVSSIEPSCFDPTFHSLLENQRHLCGTAQNKCTIRCLKNLSRKVIVVHHPSSIIHPHLLLIH